MDRVDQITLYPRHNTVSEGEVSSTSPRPHFVLLLHETVTSHAQTQNVQVPDTLVSSSRLCVKPSHGYFLEESNQNYLNRVTCWVGVQHTDSFSAISRQRAPLLRHPRDGIRVLLETIRAEPLARHGTGHEAQRGDLSRRKRGRIVRKPLISFRRATRLRQRCSL